MRNLDKRLIIKFLYKWKDVFLFVSYYRKHYLIAVYFHFSLPTPVFLEASAALLNCLMQRFHLLIEKKIKTAFNKVGFVSSDAYWESLLILAIVISFEAQLQFKHVTITFITTKIHEQNVY